MVIYNAKTTILAFRKKRTFHTGIDRLHRCWLRLLGPKYVGDKFEMLVTVFGHFRHRDLLSVHISE